MSITTKLHFILILTIIGIAVYMFLLYKEVRIFEHDVRNLRTKVASLELAIGERCLTSVFDSVQKQQAQQVASPSVDPVKKEAVQADGDIELNEDQQDDASVTSNEIQDLLSNIQQVDEHDHDHDHDHDQDQDHEVDPPIDIIEQPGSATQSVCNDDVIDDNDVKESILRAQMHEEEKREQKNVETFSEDELNSLKYNEVRVLLRKYGIQMQGTKQDMISRYQTLMSSVSHNEDTLA
jgi:hypothetical protein